MTDSILCPDGVPRSFPNDVVVAQDGFVEQENGFERRRRPAMWDARKGIDGAAGQSWSTIQAATVCSRATIAKIAKRLKAA